MEAASGAVEFLSVECDMIFEPDCDLETECQAECQKGGRDGLPSAPRTPSPPASPKSPSSLSVEELLKLFRGRNVGVYCRSDPRDNFLLVFDPTTQPPAGEGEGGGSGKRKSSGPEEEEGEEEGEGAGEGRGAGRAARCNVCRKQFRTEGCLVTHSLTHLQASPGPPPPCPVCAAVLPSRAALKIHVRRHFSTQTYQCPECQQQHLTRTQLLLHQQLHNAHWQQPPAPPSTAPQPPSTPSPAPRPPTPCKAREGVEKPPQHPAKAAEEERSSTPETETDLRCECCSAAFTTRTALWMHRKCHRERRRRRRRRRHECPECGSQFWRSSALKKHRKAEHDV